MSLKIQNIRFNKDEYTYPHDTNGAIKFEVISEKECIIKSITCSLKQSFYSDRKLDADVRNVKIELLGEQIAFKSWIVQVFHFHFPIQTPDLIGQWAGLINIIKIQIDQDWSIDDISMIAYPNITMQYPDMSQVSPSIKLYYQILNDRKLNLGMVTSSMSSQKEAQEEYMEILANKKYPSTALEIDKIPTWKAEDFINPFFIGNDKVYRPIHEQIKKKSLRYRIWTSLFSLLPKTITPRNIFIMVISSLAGILTVAIILTIVEKSVYGEEFMMWFKVLLTIAIVNIIYFITEKDKLPIYQIQFHKKENFPWKIGVFQKYIKDFQVESYGYETDYDCRILYETYIQSWYETAKWRTVFQDALISSFPLAEISWNGKFKFSSLQDNPQLWALCESLYIPSTVIGKSGVFHRIKVVFISSYLPDFIEIMELETPKAKNPIKELRFLLIFTLIFITVIYNSNVIFHTITAIIEWFFLPMITKIQ